LKGSLALLVAFWLLGKAFPYCILGFERARVLIGLPQTFALGLLEFGAAFGVSSLVVVLVAGRITTGGWNFSLLSAARAKVECPSTVLEVVRTFFMKSGDRGFSHATGAWGYSWYVPTSLAGCSTWFRVLLTSIYFGMVTLSVWVAPVLLLVCLDKLVDLRPVVDALAFDVTVLPSVLLVLGPIFGLNAGLQVWSATR
jgi:hypothetical protein